MPFNLRPWTMEDAPSVAQTLNNPTILANLRDGIPTPYTLADAQEYISHTLATPTDESWQLAIIINGLAVGNISFSRQQNIHRRTAEIGYYLGEAYWGKGIMTEAVKNACTKAFSTTNLLRIYAEPFAHNLPSCRVLEKAGFTLEGTLKSNAVKNGQVIDMDMYALIRD